MKILGVFVLFLAFACSAQAQAPQGTKDSASPAPTASPADHAGMPAVSAVLLLRTSLTSRNATEGKEVKAMLEKSVALPGRESLPKGTIIRGHVAQVSPHSKAKPNGALLLVFDEAMPKNAPPVPLIVQIRRLAPSEASEIETTNMPGSKLGGTSNAGGAQNLQFQIQDHSTLSSTGNTKLQSDIKDVYLSSSAGGSGTVLSPGQDVYLDEDIRMTVLMAPDTAKTK